MSNTIILPIALPIMLLMFKRSGVYNPSPYETSTLKKYTVRAISRMASETLGNSLATVSLSHCHFLLKSLNKCVMMSKKIDSITIGIAISAVKFGATTLAPNTIIMA